MRYVKSKNILLPVLVLLFGACSPADNEPQSLQQQVASAIASASDLPAQNLTVSVDGGAVLVTGSLECENCGGMRTPGGEDTIQQSLGAVVRAVPGVESVEFELE